MDNSTSNFDLGPAIQGQQDLAVHLNPFGGIVVCQDRRDRGEGDVYIIISRMHLAQFMADLKPYL